MGPHGTHWLVEYLDCAPARLDDAAGLERALRHAAAAAGVRVLACTFHAFEPHGVTGILLLEESHLSIHTWPERAYAAVDFYTCGASDPSRAELVLREALEARRVERLVVERGRLDAARVITASDEAHCVISSGGGSSNALSSKLST